MGVPDSPSSSPRPLRESVVSDPSSRKAYVSTSRPPSTPLTRTGTIRRLTRGRSDPMAAQCPSLLAPVDWPGLSPVSFRSEMSLGSSRGVGECTREWCCSVQPLNRQALARLHLLAWWFTCRQLWHNFSLRMKFFLSSQYLSRNLKHLSSSWLSSLQ